MQFLRRMDVSQIPISTSPWICWLSEDCSVLYEVLNTFFFLLASVRTGRDGTSRLSRT